jgi:hypothetical protein
VSDIGTAKVQAIARETITWLITFLKDTEPCIAHSNYQRESSRFMVLFKSTLIPLLSGTVSIHKYEMQLWTGVFLVGLKPLWRSISSPPSTWEPCVLLNHLAKHLQHRVMIESLVLMGSITHDQGVAPLRSSQAHKKARRSIGANGQTFEGHYNQLTTMGLRGKINSPDKRPITPMLEKPPNGSASRIKLVTGDAER